MPRSAASIRAQKAAATRQRNRAARAQNGGPGGADQQRPPEVPPRRLRPRRGRPPAGGNNGADGPNGNNNAGENNVDNGNNNNDNGNNNNDNNNNGNNNNNFDLAASVEDANLQHLLNSSPGTRAAMITGVNLILSQFRARAGNGKRIYPFFPSLLAFMRLTLARGVLAPLFTVRCARQLLSSPSTVFSRRARYCHRLILGVLVIVAVCAVCASSNFTWAHCYLISISQRVRCHTHMPPCIISICLSMPPQNPDTF